MTDRRIICDMSADPLWHTQAGNTLSLWVNGCAHYLDQYYEAESLLDFVAGRLRSLEPSDGKALLRKLVPALNGSWAMVAYWGNGEAMLSVDRYRSIPLFYRPSDSEYRVADSAWDLPHAAMNDTAATELLMSGYVSGRDTLAEGVYQVEAGESIEIFSDGARLVHRKMPYFVHFPGQVSDAGYEDLTDELFGIVERVCERFGRVLKNKKPVVPLSAGFDSRLIVWMLRELGKSSDTLCITYGTRSDPQNQTASTVAKTAEMRWHFLEYTRDCWHQALLGEQSKAHWRYASKGTSLPHIQDYPMVLDLSQRGLIDSSNLFLPGHVGDAWASEFAVLDLDGHNDSPPQEYHSKYVDVGDPAASSAIYRHLNMFPLEPETWVRGHHQQIADKITRNMHAYESPRPDPVWRMIEWVLRSRTCLWVVNGIRTYEFFGARGYMPLSDYELIDFFRRLPLDFLLDRNLYAYALRKHLFYPCDDPLRGTPIQSGGTRQRGPKEKLIRALQTLGLYMPLERIRHRRRPERNLNFEHWFTRGQRSETLSYGEVLEPFNVREVLPASIYDVIKPLLNRPSYAVHCNGVFASIFLAAMYADQ